MSKAEPELRPLEDVDPLLAGHASALRDVETPAPDRVEAIWTAVEAETRHQTRGRSRLWIPLVLAAAAVLLGIVFVGPSSVLDRGETSRPNQTPYRSDGPATGGRAESKQRPAAAKPAPKPNTLPRVVEPDPEPEGELATPLRAAVPKRRKPDTAAVSPGPSSLAQETSLLRELQRAQAAKDHRRVLELTDAHRRRFAKGTFVAERSLARVRALCALGRATDAREAGQDFIRKHPRSHLVSQFKAACPL